MNTDRHLYQLGLARHAELIVAASVARQLHRRRGPHLHLTDRLILAVSALLITTGCRLREAVSIKYLLHSQL